MKKQFKKYKFFKIILFFIFIYFLTLYIWNEKRWRYIVIHHTASDFGNLEYYTQLHQKERGWNNIAYHFVINNGTFNTVPGQIEESELWKERRIGFSTKNWLINYFGIAIVIVGNLENHPPNPQQYEALINLLIQLIQKYKIVPERIMGHREIQNTKCPGKYLNMAKLRLEVRNRLESKK